MTTRYRRGGMGQLDSELNYGPSPLPFKEVPADLRPKFIDARLGAGQGGASGLDALGDMAKDLHAIAGTILLDRGLLGRIVQVTSTPTLICDAQDPSGRGYLLLNPAGVTGLTTVGTFIAANTLVGATTLTSGILSVANYKTASFFLEISFGAGAGPVTFDLQTKNPVTGTFITSQTIFAPVATGNLYANVGALGVDTDMQILVTVPLGTTVTFSVGYCLKDGLEGTSAGVIQTIFIGGAGVSSSSGYPILSGKEKQFYLKENTKLYAVSAGPTLNMNIFEL